MFRTPVRARLRAAAVTLAVTGGLLATSAAVTAPSASASIVSYYSNAPAGSWNYKVNQVIYQAQHQLGKPYRYGAAGPSAFDCSGLVMWAFAQEGIALPHYTGAQWNMGMHVARADLEPGDLVFFGADISHVGIYIGDGLMVDAPNSGAVVRVEPLFSDYVGAVRIA